MSAALLMSSSQLNLDIRQMLQRGVKNLASLRPDTTDAAPPKKRDCRVRRYGLLLGREMGTMAWHRSHDAGECVDTSPTGGAHSFAVIRRRGGCRECRPSLCASSCV